MKEKPLLVIIASPIAREKEAIRLYKKYLLEKKSFSMETTLSGKYVTVKSN